MPNVLQSSRWISLFVHLLILPATAPGQMEFHGSPFGMDPASMDNSCTPCQEAAGEPDWFDPSYGGFEADGFGTECGCDASSSMALPPFAGSAYPVPCDQQCGMSPYGCDACQMPPDINGYAAPPGFPSACHPYEACSPAGCAVPAPGCEMCCPCGNAAPLWLSAEALIWHTTGSSLPPMLTNTNGPDTTTLFGGNNLFTGMHGGFRLRGGVNFDQCGVSGLDAEFFLLGTRHEGFSANAANSQQLIRPFFDVSIPGPNGQEVPTGHIDFRASSSLNSGALHYREVFWKECNPGYDCPDNCWRSGPQSFALGFQIGPRFVNLRESFVANENLTASPANPSPNGHQIQDSFRTKNQFLGTELGLFGNWQRRRWSLNGGVRLGIGSTNQRLDVSGHSTVTSPNNVVLLDSAGGLLALSSNSGSWNRNRFTLLPQFDVGLGYQMTNTWRASVGYSLMYWGNVLRATEQIDPVINPALLPPEIPTTDPLRPQTLWHESGFLAHGITIGLERRW